MSDDAKPHRTVRVRLSDRQIAKITGTSPRTVSRGANAAGETVSPTVLGADNKVYWYGDDRLDRAGLHLRLRAEGRSLREIASITQTSPATVLRDLRAYRLAEDD